ncbi:MAG: hypothetical protein GX275_06540 [Clostridiales bacterium]|nr:hypothetical protein [Clostridiales bacterium]
MKKRITSILLLLIILICCSQNAISVAAVDFQNIYKEGTYEVNNNIVKIDSDEASVARKYVNEKSIIEISEEGILTTITFNQKTLMSNIKVKVNGKETEYIEEDVSDKELSIKFNLDSLEDSIEIDLKVNAGIINMDVAFRVKNDISKIPLISDENIGLPEVPDDTIVEPEVSIPSNPVVVEKPVISDSSSHVVYSVKNEIITDSQIGYSAARSAVSVNSYLEDINGIQYITIGLSNLDYMSNIRVEIDGNKIGYEVLRKDENNNTMDIRFMVSSINSNVKITAYINMIGIDISFGIDFLEDTMEIIKNSEISKPLAQKSSEAVAYMNYTDTNLEDVNEEKEIEGELEVRSYFKRYTIENDIISDSIIGKNMTRKYLDKISILEDIDDRLYLTIKFTGSDAMDNIRIMINEKEVDYSVVAKDESNGLLALRFEITNINDDIRVYMKIKAVNMNVDFGIDLLEDTMVLVEEGQASQINENNNKVLNKLMENSEGSNNKTIILLTAAITAIIIFIVEGIVFIIIRKGRVLKG